MMRHRKASQLFRRPRHIQNILKLGLTSAFLLSIGWNVLIVSYGTRHVKDNIVLSGNLSFNPNPTLGNLRTQTKSETKEDYQLNGAEEEEKDEEVENKIDESPVEGGEEENAEDNHLEDLQRHLQRRREQHEEAANHIASGESTDDKEKQVPEDDKISFDFDYDSPVNKTSLLPDPIIFDNNLIVMVMSARNNLEHRQAIRETWGSGHTLLFLIGGEISSVLSVKNETIIQQEKDLQKRLTIEQDTYHDLLDTIHPESYKSLPHKLKFSMHWINKNVKNYNWVMKADDDIFVRVDSLENMVLQMFQPETPIVVGNIARRASVLRKGKWAERKYKKHVYPTFALGGNGYIVSRKVVEYIATTYESEKSTNAETLSVYQGEDTSLGIWLSKSQLDVFWIHSPYFVLEGDCRAAKSPLPDMDRVNPLQRKQSSGFSLSMGHNISPALMKLCYETGDEWKWRIDRNYAMFTRQQSREAVAFMRGGMRDIGDKPELGNRGFLQQLDNLREQAQEQQKLKRIDRERRRQDLQSKQFKFP